MIVAEQKPLDEILEIVKDCKLALTARRSGRI